MLLVIAVVQRFINQKQDLLFAFVPQPHHADGLAHDQDQANCHQQSKPQRTAMVQVRQECPHSDSLSSPGLMSA